MDKGYVGHSVKPKFSVCGSGQKRSVSGVITKELRRRSVTELIIGHLKSDHRMDKNYLKGV